KLMSVVALVIAPSIALDTEVLTAYVSDSNMVVRELVTKDIKVDTIENEDGTFKAVVTTIITDNGNKSITYENFTGTEGEVKANVEILRNQGSTDTSDIVNVQIVDDVIVK